jgi:hypothetical protein
VSAEFAEFLGTLTGAEELAIRDAFGRTIDDMATGYAQRRAAQFRQASQTRP